MKQGATSKEPERPKKKLIVARKSFGGKAPRGAGKVNGNRGFWRLKKNSRVVKMLFKLGKFDIELNSCFFIICLVSWRLGENGRQAIEGGETGTGAQRENQEDWENAQEEQALEGRVPFQFGAHLRKTQDCFSGAFP